MEMINTNGSLRIKGVLYKFGLFKCPNCGVEIKLPIRDGKRNKSCGCNRYNHGHGDTGKKLYRVWSTMKERCLNENSEHYKSYGGRGISVCSEWIKSYKSFREWALKNGYKEGLQIDRMDNNSGYSPSNCRFATREENCRNKNNNKITQNQANEIRLKRKTGMYTLKMLSDMYKISQGYVSEIVSNKYRKNLKPLE